MVDFVSTILQAEENACNIIKDAEDKAKDILSNAEAQACQILKKANQDMRDKEQQNRQEAAALAKAEYDKLIAQATKKGDAIKTVNVEKTVEYVVDEFLKRI